VRSGCLTLREGVDFSIAFTLFADVFLGFVMGFGWLLALNSPCAVDCNFCCSLEILAHSGAHRPGIRIEGIHSHAPQIRCAGDTGPGETHTHLCAES
jgi:hypothetical protein